MKKGIALALLLIVALGTGVLATEVKTSGEVGYAVEVPTGEGYHSYDGYQYVPYKLTFDAVIDDQTSAKLEVKGAQVGAGLGPKIFRPTGIFTTAEVRTKLNGIGTFAAGINPDYGTSPFAVAETFEYGDLVSTNLVWGRRNSAPGISFASEKLGGLAGQVFLNPWSEDYDYAQFAGEVTYDLPVLAGTTAGLAFSKWNDDDNLDWAVIGNVAVTDSLSLYGELGTVDGASDLNDKSFGARAKLGAATLVAEAFLDDTWGNGFYFQASYPFNGLALSASYMTGDGWADYLDSYYDGLFKLSAKVSF